MRIFVILLGLLILQSCTREDSLETPDESKVDFGYRYSKKVEVFDTEGNSAVVHISSNDLQDLSNTNADDLELRVTRKDFNKSNNNNKDIELVTYNEETQVTKDFSNYILIDIVTTNLKEDITGFFVEMNTLPDVGTRGGKYKKFSYGSTGTRGAGVEFISEERGSCKLEIDLDKLTTSNSIWYSEMADAKLKDPPGHFNHWSSTEYYKYRLTVDINGWNCGTYDVDWWYWWIK